MPKTVDCPECNGTGIVISEVEQSRLEGNGSRVFILDEIEIPCDNCRGTSFVELTDEDQADLEECFYGNE